MNGTQNVLGFSVASLFGWNAGCESYTVTSNGADNTFLSIDSSN